MSTYPKVLIGLNLACALFNLGIAGVFVVLDRPFPWVNAALGVINIAVALAVFHVEAIYLPSEKEHL